MNRRVGVRQYIVLGALAQMPNGRMSRVDLANHVNRVAPGTPLLSMLTRLMELDFIRPYGSSDVLMLTESGAGVRCERRRAETAVFARVSNTTMAVYND